MKKTVICESCAKARNCCQCCSVDIDYQIPLDLRDAALKLAGIANPYSVENTSKNREVKAIIGDKIEKRLKNEGSETAEEKKEKMRDILTKLAQKLGSGAVANTSMPKERTSGGSTTKELSKTIATLPFGGSLALPKNNEDRSFFVFGFSADMPQYKLSEFFETHGKIKSVRIVHKAKCGYVVFDSRSDADKCASAISSNGLNSNLATAGLILVNSQPVRVSWGNSQPLGRNNDEQAKIAQVVTKVMKQLAERDALQKGKRTKKLNGSHSTKRQKLESQERTDKETKEVKQSYKALSRDLEL